ncbi:MAG: galactokinase [Mariniblastus sp.]|nr:galactokinase [Mariniblastus sp.]
MALLEQALRAFEERFGSGPEIAAQAPGRVNLIGEHIDYNDGLVLPMAIDRYTVIAGGRTTGDGYHFYLPGRDQFFSAPDLKLGDHSPPWAGYVLGVLKQFELAGFPVPPLRAVIVSDVPPGSGLSSSAALEVATATLAEQLTGHIMAPMEKAYLCQRAEHESAGVPCGIMDQASAILCQRDSVLELDCRDQNHRQLPFVPEGLGVLVTNSKVQHNLATGNYATRRQECELAASKLDIASWRHLTPDQFDQISACLPETLLRRGQHVVSEIARTLQASEAIESGQWSSLGELLYQSHESLRDHFQVSCPELDLLVDFTSDLPGVLGSRMTGGGFGGCTVSLIELAERPFIERAIVTKYQAATGMEPELFVTRPSDGAQPISL